MVKSQNYPYNTYAVSEKLYDVHVQLYNGYVDKTNEISDKLKAEKTPLVSNAVYSPYRGLKKGETFALNAVILHEAYFQNMTTALNCPNNQMITIANRFFGDFDNWLDDFTNCCKAARGWGLFVYEQRSKTFRNIALDAHDDGAVCLSFPILVMDMYEHAYAMDYGKDKDTYIKRFIKSICWQTVALRLEKLGMDIST